MFTLLFYACYNKNGDTMNIIYLIIGLGIFLFVLAIFLYILTAVKSHKNIIVTKNPEELKKFMEENNFPPEMINGMINENTTFSSTKTTRTIRYENGEIVSDETTTVSNSYPQMTNCPNCKSVIEPNNNGTCRYCGTSFK